MLGGTGVGRQAHLDGGTLALGKVTLLGELSSGHPPSPPPQGSGGPCHPPSGLPQGPHELVTRSRERTLF